MGTQTEMQSYATYCGMNMMNSEPLIWIDLLAVLHDAKRAGAKSPKPLHPCSILLPYVNI